MTVAHENITHVYHREVGRLMNCNGWRNAANLHKGTKLMEEVCTKTNRSGWLLEASSPMLFGEHLFREY